MPVGTDLSSEVIGYGASLIRRRGAPAESERVMSAGAAGAPPGGCFRGCRTDAASLVDKKRWSRTSLPPVRPLVLLNSSNPLSKAPEVDPARLSRSCLPRRLCPAFCRPSRVSSAALLRLSRREYVPFTVPRRSDKNAPGLDKSSNGLITRRLCRESGSRSGATEGRHRPIWGNLPARDRPKLSEAPHFGCSHQDSVCLSIRRSRTIPSQE